MKDYFYLLRLIFILLKSFFTLYWKILTLLRLLKYQKITQFEVYSVTRGKHY